jgi:hypothetical protein
MKVWRILPVKPAMTVRDRTGWVWIFDQLGGDYERMSSKFRSGG